MAKCDGSLRRKSTSSSDIRSFFKPKTEVVESGDKRKRNATARSSGSPVKKKPKEEEEAVLRPISSPQQPGKQKIFQLPSKKMKENRDKLNGSFKEDRMTIGFKKNGEVKKKPGPKSKQKIGEDGKKRWKLKIPRPKSKRFKFSRGGVPFGDSFSEESSPSNSDHDDEVQIKKDAPEKFSSEEEEEESSKSKSKDVKVEDQFSSESDDEILFPNNSNCDKEKEKDLPVVIPLVKNREETVQESQESKEDLESYEVEKIVNYSWCKESKGGLYRVKWVNWAEEHNTWEPISNLADCQELLKEFYSNRLQERENATPSQKRFLEVPPDPRSSYERRSDFADKICPPPCMSEAEMFMRNMKNLKRLPPAALKSKLEKISKKKNPGKQVIEELRDQIMLRHIDQMKGDQLKRLKEWETEVNDLSAENAKITVENDFDLEGPPRHMTYINEYKPSPGIVIPDDPPMGCECEKCGIQTEKSCCPGLNGQPIGYNLYGKLRVPLGHPIYECNKKCKCGPECSNRVVQKGRKVKLCIYRTSNGCGWGVKTLGNIKRGSFVVEYVGEVITSDEAEERGKKYDAEGRTYLFDLDYNMGDANPYTVDAAFYGNVSHFINHSCDPNLVIFNVWIDCLDPNLPRLCMFALRDIVKGEQITFDYRQRAAGPADPSSSEGGDFNDEARNKMECRCGTANCRKILFG